jgi:hypothetical protein
MKCTKNFNNNGLNQSVQMQQDALQKLILGFAPSLQQNNLLSEQIPKIDTSILEGLNKYAKEISNLMSPSFDSIINQQSEVSKMIESMQFNLPKIDSSIFEGLRNTQIESISKNFNNNELSQFVQMQQEALQKLNLGFAPSLQQNNLLSEQIPKIDTSIFEGLNKYTKEIFSLMNNPSFSIMNQQSEVIKMIESMQSNLPKIDSSIFEELRNNQDLYNNYQGLNARELFEQSFESLNKFAKEMYLNDDVDFSITYDDIEEINKKIEQKKPFSQKDLVTYIGIVIGFIISIIGCINDGISLYLIFNPDNSEHIKTQQMIQKLDNKWSKSLNQNTYYEITKQANVREFPDSKSKKIAVANPKQKLLIIQNKPYWLQVEYFDTHKNETIIGWVSKRYTKKLDEITN